MILRENILWSLYEYLLCLIEIVLFYDFLSFMLKRNRRIKNKYHYLSIAMLSVFIFVLTEIDIYSMVRTIVMYIVFLFVSYKLFKGQVKEKVLFVTMFYFFLIFGDIITVNIISAFVRRDIQNIVINQTWARIAFSQISKLLLFIILRLIKNNYKERESDIPRYYWFWILFICSISVVNLLVVFNISMILNELSIEIQHLIVIISLGTLLVVVITYYVFIKMNAFYKEKNNYKIVDIKNEMLTKGIEEKEKVYEGIRKINHDFKNHIICIKELLEEDKLKSAIEYIDSLKDKAFEVYTWINTGNDIVDAILNQKKSEGNNKNIDIDIKVSIPEDINIDTLDLCTILGNALDNSIEANEKIEDENKRNIKVRINPYKEYLFIEILNPSIVNPIDEEGRLITTKQDKEKHGFGIKSMESAVEKYDGMLSYEYNNGEFVLNIMLPIC